MDNALPTQSIPVSHLRARRRSHFAFRPGSEDRAAIAMALGLLELPQLTFKGEITPEGQGDLLLEGDLAAEAVQACVVTLAPVPFRTSGHVIRRYLADWQEPAVEESEIPEDDTIEPLPGSIDVASVAIEALALALPDYPRVPGAEIPPEGTDEPEDDAAAGEDGTAKKPLAGLADLLARKAEDE